MEFANLFESQHVRLTALRDGDAAIMAGWHEDSWFVRLINADSAHSVSFCIATASATICSCTVCCAESGRPATGPARREA